MTLAIGLISAFASGIFFGLHVFDSAYICLVSSAWAIFSHTLEHDEI